MHTGTEAVGKANGLSGISGAASLVGAVTDTVAEVGLAAVAGNVALSAAELGVRNAEHAVDAGALWDRGLGVGLGWTTNAIATKAPHTSCEMPMATGSTMA